MKWVFGSSILNDAVSSNVNSFDCFFCFLKQELNLKNIYVGVEFKNERFRDYEGKNWFVFFKAAGDSESPGCFFTNLVTVKWRINGIELLFALIFSVFRKIKKN